MPPSRPPAALPYSIALTAIRSFHHLCTLVMVGVRPDGTKELITVEDGYLESAESWTTVLRDLKRRSMRPPGVAVGDGAIGFLPDEPAPRYTPIRTGLQSGHLRDVDSSGPLARIIWRK